eukprot:TRINITY_DN15566_c0_g1_i1.p3 TRINITY_DN15566_c0_g1~~TRINITY_DN15566_c0_g1_i1.p3  ORF type:complete len:117 (-),score=24.21 TRINITY_DN15566_c0_g1_i1:747-1097(-)
MTKIYDKNRTNPEKKLLRKLYAIKCSEKTKINMKNYVSERKPSCRVSKRLYSLENTMILKKKSRDYLDNRRCQILEEIRKSPSLFKVFPFPRRVGIVQADESGRNVGGWDGDGWWE